VFLESDLRCGFDGLTKMMQKEKYSITDKDKPSFVLFMNKARTAFKLFVGPHYLMYYKNGYRRIPLEAISRIPRYFNGKALNMRGAIAETVQAQLSLN